MISESITNGSPQLPTKLEFLILLNRFPALSLPFYAKLSALQDSIRLRFRLALALLQDSIQLRFRPALALQHSTLYVGGGASQDPKKVRSYV